MLISVPTREEDMYAKCLMLKSKITNSDIGASMVEYSLLIVLIAIVALIAVEVAGSELSTTYSEIASDVGNAGP